MHDVRRDARKKAPSLRPDKKHARGAVMSEKQEDPRNFCVCARGLKDQKGRSSTPSTPSAREGGPLSWVWVKASTTQFHGRLTFPNRGGIGSSDPRGLAARVPWTHRSGREKAMEKCGKPKQRGSSEAQTFQATPGFTPKAICRICPIFWQLPKSCWTH